MLDKAYWTFIKLMPKAAVSTAVGVATRLKAPPVMHRAAMRWFAARYRVDLGEAERGIDEFDTFAEFFTRRLKPGLRQVDTDPKVVISPVDGAISQIGYVENGQCLQAKGVYFPVGKLIGDQREANAFDGGGWATIYLSPRDYHRIHSPLDGKITGYTYLPGEFWPVNAASVKNTDALFAINERLVTWLDTPQFGRVAVVAVGATCVSRIHASYDEVITHQGHPAQAKVYDQPIPVQKAAELGMFEMGSTVILLFEKGRVKWDERLVADLPVRLGEKIGVVP